MRDRLLSLLAAGVFASALILDQSHPAAQAPTPTWTPELMMTVKRVPAVVPSPDGAHVAFVVGEAVTEGERSEWVNQIHVAAADGSGSRQLTRGEKSSSDPLWSPDGKSLAFLSSRSGKANIWRIDVSGGEAEQITDEKGGVSAFEWSPDGAFFAFVMRDAKTEAEEKADKEKRDWRTLDEQVKMNRLYVVAAREGRRWQARGAAPDQARAVGERLRVVARRQDDRVRPPEDAAGRRLAVRRRGDGQRRRRHGDAAGDQLAGRGPGGLLAGRPLHRLRTERRSAVVGAGAARADRAGRRR